MMNKKIIAKTNNLLATIKEHKEQINSILQEGYFFDESSLAALLIEEVSMNFGIHIIEQSLAKEEYQFLEKYVKAFKLHEVECHVGHEQVSIAVSAEDYRMGYDTSLWNLKTIDGIDDAITEVNGLIETFQNESLQFGFNDGDFSMHMPILKSYLTKLENRKKELVNMNKKTIQNNTERIKAAHEIAVALRIQKPDLSYGDALKMAFKKLDNGEIEMPVNQIEEQKEKEEMKQEAINKNVQRMKAAHAIAKEIKEQQPELKYKDALNMAFKQLNDAKVNAPVEPAKEVEEATPVEPTTPAEENKAIKVGKMLVSKDVTINNVTREVALKMEAGKLFGRLNKSRFVWDYKQYALPTVEVNDPKLRKKAAIMGRAYIVERLKMDNITLDIRPVDQAKPKATILNTQTVIVNNIERAVAIKIEGDKMFGVLNKTRFIWDFKKYSLPTVEVKDPTSRAKAASYARLFILERLKMANINLDIKTKASNVKYIHLDTVNGVWINAFENGYLRGQVDGVSFVWKPLQFKEAVSTDKGTNKIDTARIRARLKAAGYNTYNTLMNAIKNGLDKTENYSASKSAYLLAQQHNLNDVAALFVKNSFAVEDVISAVNTLAETAKESQDTHLADCYVTVLNALAA